MVNYTFSGGYYWETSCQQYIPIQGYTFLIWKSTYYAGHLLQILLLAYSLDTIFGAREIPEEGSKYLVGFTLNETLTFFVGLTVWTMITTVLSIGSINVEYVEEMAQNFNQILLFDNNMESKCHRKTPAEETQKLETLMKLFVLASILIPLTNCASFFHPANPIRGLAEFLFEIDFAADNISTCIIITFEFWVGICFSGIAFSAIAIVFTFISVVRSWLNGVMPVSKATKLSNGSVYFQTNVLGKVTDDKLILICRSLQCLTVATNNWLGKCRSAYHFLGCLIITVCSSFAFIRTAGLIIREGNLIDFCVAGFLIISGYVFALIVFMECLYLEYLESTWAALKSNMFKCCHRQSAAYKSVRSFPIMSLHTVHPFCNVNQSTFPEWYSTALNRLIDLLLTF